MIDRVRSNLPLTTELSASLGRHDEARLDQLTLPGVEELRRL
jgi:hypothetical protein